MQHRLILMRHAKSDHDDASLADHERVLSGRGRRDSPVMANWLADHGVIPDKMLVSSSRRTRETVDLMLPEWPTRPEVVYSESLYLASAEALLWTARTESDQARSTLLLAHNPGIATLASSLCRQMLSMPTAAIAVFDVESESGANPLSELDEQTRIALTHYVTPKSLDATSE